MYQGNYYQLMAKYNRWMNQKLYAVCVDIPDTKRKTDLGAFFKSIHGTLNHILWADRAWLQRFAGQEPKLTPIGQDLYVDFDELRVQREAMDKTILQWVKKLQTDWLEQRFEFTSVVDGKTRSGPGWLFVTHFFNHQTHHRGQLSTLIKQLGYEPGTTDIPLLPGVIQ